MIESDDQNLVFVDSAAAVDRLNAKFYGRFPFPWRPVRLDFLTDPNFYTIMLNQDLADWSHAAVPASARIWVAGCGTNQAVFTALRFPGATIIGSDLSTESLEICDNTAKQLGLRNLELRQESLNEVDYRDEFDYVISTGVIHHNADPRVPLERLSAALKPSGVLELMVYNRYHRIITSAFQKAVRVIEGEAPSPDFETELSIARALINKFPADNLVASFLRPYRDNPEPALADALLQPVEYSFTVESLEKLARSCALELLHPCSNQSNRGAETHAWNMEFSDPGLQQRYESLPDTRRWQVANLLLFESSPMLWFYLQRRDSGRARRSEKQACEEFLNTTFVKAATTQRSYISDGNARYSLLSQSAAYPASPRDPFTRTVLDSIDGRKTMKEVFEQHGLPLTFAAVNKARVRLTTSAFPYLIAVRGGRSDGGSSSLTSVEVSPDESRQKLQESSYQKLKAVRRKPIVGPTGGKE